MLKQLLLTSVMYGLSITAHAYKYYEPFDIVATCAQAEKNYKLGQDLQSQYVWGAILIKGCCNDGNFTEGFKLVENAANRGNRDAIYHYAQLIFDFVPERKPEVETLIYKAANLGQLDALAYYGNQRLNSGNVIESCIYYNIAIKQNPSHGVKMSDVWRDTYSKYMETFRGISELNQGQCETVALTWRPDIDLRHHLDINMKRYLNR